MAKSLKKSIIQGTLILTFAGIIARLLGFYNRIFLCNLFGERELGIYQMVFPVYMVIFSLCCQGIQTSLTRQIARCAVNDEKTKACLLKHALFLSMTLSILCSIVVFCFADWICNHILHSLECKICLQILCFAFPFVSVKGCLIGYFIGIQKSGITATSQFVEQLTKIGSVYIIATYVLTAQPKAYFALYGVVFGEFFSCLFMLICYLRIHMHAFQTEQTEQTSSPVSCKKTPTMELIHDAIPLTTNRLSLTFLQSMESVLIPHMLNLYLNNGDESLILYGTLSGLVMPCIMFPTTLTSSLATMLLPTISAKDSAQGYRSLRPVILKSIYFCSAIGIASTIFLFFCGTWVGQTLFSSSTAGELLVQFALLCPFIYLSSCLASIMNGIGKAALNLILSILCIGIRIGCILVLIPSIGLTGYLWGMLISYLLQTILLISIILRSLRS